MSQVNILHVIGGNEIGGAEEHVLSLCKGLDYALFRPHLVCLCHGPFQARAEAEGIKTTTIAMSNPFDLRVIPKLQAFMRSSQIGLVHTHGSRANLTARTAAYLLGIPVVTTVHSSLRLDYTKKLNAAAALLLDRITMPLASRVITVSDSLQPEVRRRGAKRVTTIYNGIDPSKYENLTSPEHLYSKFKLDSSRPVVGTIGRLHPIKGQRYFLEAAALVERANPGNQFLVVGSGPLEWELRELAQSLGIGDKVVFTGYYPHIEEVLAVMDIMCLPSLAEGMGLVLLEAMLLGVPIVASRVGGIPELVKDGETGLLVPPADSQALAKGVSGLLRDRNLRAGLRERGRQRFNDFTLDQMLKHTETLYLDVLHERDRH